MPIKAAILESGLTEQECLNNVGGHLDEKGTCVLDTLEFDGMKHSGEPTWLSKEAVEEFYRMNFSSDKTFRELAQFNLNAKHGIVPVDGSIYFPAEHLGSVHGHYGQIYCHDETIFVPITYEGGGVLNE